MTGWREHDGRLVPAAAGCWATTAFGELGLGTALAWLTAACGVTALLAILAGWRYAATRAITVLVGASIAGSALAGLLALDRLDSRSASPVAQAALQDAFVRVTGEVDGRPRPVRGSADRVVVPVSVDSMTLRDGTVATAVQVVVLGDANDWRHALPGTPVQITGTAHTPDRRSSVVAVVIDSGSSRIGRSAPRWSVIAQKVRDGLRDAASVNAPDTAGLLVAMVDGDTSGISPVVQEDFRRAGLAHLLAVSGANVAIVVGSVLWLTRLLRAPFAAQIACGAAGLASFMVVAGPEPSVLRAAAMGVVMIVALASGRPRAAVPALCAAVIVLLAALPSLSTSAGFALSVLATAGIVVLGAAWTDSWSRHLPRPLAAALAVAASAMVATLPVIVLLLPVVNVSSLVANMVVVPAVPLATICGVAACVIAPVALLPAQWLCYAGGFAVRWVEVVARAVSEPGPLQIRLPAGIGALALVCLALLALVVTIRLGRRHPLLRTIAGGVAVGALVVSAPVRCAVKPWPPSGWVVAACDVGQGDATVVRAGDGSAVVLDTGPDAALLDRCLRELGVSSVPVLLLTHFHDDHVAGTPAVVGKREVGRVVIGAYDGAAVEASIRSITAAAGVPVLEVGAGWSYETGAVTVQVLGPPKPIIGTTSDPNNNSLIVRVTAGPTSVLITGDAQHELQTAMIGCGCLGADILKVAHHGSKNRDDRFAAATGARLALVSVGAGNDYGHPAPSTLAELERLGMTVRRTDLDGIVVVTERDGALAVVSGGRRTDLRRRRCRGSRPPPPG